MRAGKIQVDREKRTMFEDRTDMRVRIQQGIWQKPVCFHINSQTGPTMSHRYTPQNQQPLNNCNGQDGFNNNINDGFSSSPTDWMQHQALMLQNTMSLPKISIDNFTGDP